MLNKTNKTTLPQEKGKVNSHNKIFLSLAKYILIVMGVFTMFIASSGKSYACMCVCFSDGSCYEMEGDCSTVCAGDNGYPTCEAAIMFRESDYLLSMNGKAWLVTADKKTPVASDDLSALILKLNAKYPIGTRDDEKTQARIHAAYTSFFKSGDNGKVSDKRLKVLSKETGLRILDSAPVEKTPKK